MGPNNEVDIGTRFAPFYPDDRVPNPALDTWSGDSWRRGGLAVWGWFTYDAEMNLFYYGTSKSGPWNPDWSAQELDFADGERGKVVVQHEPLVYLPVDELDLLLVVRRSQPRRHQRLRLAACDHCRAVGSR